MLRFGLLRRARGRRGLVRALRQRTRLRRRAQRSSSRRSGGQSRARMPRALWVVRVAACCFFMGLRGAVMQATAPTARA